MLRFKYKNKYLSFSSEDNNSFDLVKEGSFDKEERKIFFDEDNLESKFKNKFDNYKDFINFLEKKKAISCNTTFYFMNIQNHCLYMFYMKDIEIKNNLSPFLIYKFENEHLENLFNKIIKNNSYDLIMVSSSLYNDFDIIMPIEAFKVILEYNAAIADNRIPYNIFKIKQKRGKIRTIIAPDDELKQALREMNSVFQKMYDSINSDFQVAYKLGKNVKTNAAIHVNNNYIYNIDLKHFYESCHRDLVRKYVKKMFSNCINRNDIIEIFLDSILLNDALFVGSPISGCLANRIIAKPVEYMRAICKQYNIELSVYADDITFSSQKFLNKKFVFSIFNKAFEQYDLTKYFRLNHKKSIGASNHKRRVTGVVINDKNQLTMQRSYYRIIRVLIHKLSTEGPNAVNIKELKGKIAYGLMIDDSGKLYRYLMKYIDIVVKYNLCSNSTIEKLNKKYEGDES